MTGKLKWQKETIAEDELSIFIRKSARIETVEQADEAAIAMQADNFWPMIERLAARCDAILEDSGFPLAKEWVRHDGEGKWWRQLPDESKKLEPGEKRMSDWGANFTQAHTADFSNSWYAARIGWECGLALEHHCKGDTGKPFLFMMVFEIASLHTDWRWRSGQKPSILTGKKQRKTLSKARETVNAKSNLIAATRCNAIAAMLRNTHLEGGALVKYLQRRLEQEADTNVSDRTIRRDLKNLRDASAKKVGQPG